MGARSLSVIEGVVSYRGYTGWEILVNRGQATEVNASGEANYVTNVAGSTVGAPQPVTQPDAPGRFYIRPPQPLEKQDRNPGTATVPIGY